MSSSIESLENQIRERLIKFGQSKFGRQKWYEIVAALDNIGDTALALNSYRNSGLGKTFSSQYLRLFGVLQSVYLQQDSIHTLCNDTIGSWNAPLPNSGWGKIRHLRNVIGGHPAESSGAVARITIKSQQLLVTVLFAFGCCLIYTAFNSMAIGGNYGTPVMAIYHHGYCSFCPPCCPH